MYFARLFIEQEHIAMESWKDDSVSKYVHIEKDLSLTSFSKNEHLSQQRWIRYKQFALKDISFLSQ